MKEVLFIAAGTKGAKKVANELQPYIRVNGRMSIEYVLDAAMRAKRVGDIYIWGDKKKLENITKRFRDSYENSIIIIEERDNIVESFIFSYLRFIADGKEIRNEFNKWDHFKDIDWNIVYEYAKAEDLLEKQVNVITSDTPLVTSRELDYILKHRNKDADIVIGRTTQKDVEWLFSRIGEPFNYDLAVKNYYTYYKDGQEYSLIVNNFVSVKPLKLNKNIWYFAEKWYDNRTIIAGRKKDIDKISNNVASFKKLFLKTQEKKEHAGYLQRFKAAFFLIRSYLAIVKGRKANNIYRDLDVISQKGKLLTGYDVEYLISPCFGVAFDLDTAYEVEFVRRNFSALRQLSQERLSGQGAPIKPSGGEERRQVGLEEVEQLQNQEDMQQA